MICKKSLEDENVDIRDTATKAIINILISLKFN